MRLIAKWVIVALAFLALPKFIPGIGITASLGTALVVALVWGVLQSLIRPVVLLVLLPLNLITLGLFSFVVNALLFWVLGSFIKGFEVNGFIPAFLGALVISGVVALANLILRDKED